MAQRRMFSPDIVSSDAFLDMPVSSQVLYFHLAMRADDDGFVTPKMVMRLIGSSDDDLKVLIAKRFLLKFETGVVVVKHWLIHNLIRSDLYKETLYKKEKSSLGLNENGAYTELRDGVSEIKQIEAPEWLKRRRGDLRTANVPQTVPRLGKVRLGKERPSAPRRKKPAKYNSLGTEILKAFEMVDPKNKTYYENTTQRAACDFLLQEYGMEKVLQAIKLLPQINQQKLYITQITTPYELKENWVKIGNALKQKKEVKKTIIV